MSYKLIKASEPQTFTRFLKRAVSLDLFKGLKITLLEFFSPKTIVTIKYPLEKIPLSPRYRTIHKLMRLLESGENRCIGCGLCEKICIANCIKINTSYGADSRKKIESYTINFGRCIYCGFCAEVCPEIAIVHGERYENVSEQRAHFAPKSSLLTPIDLALSNKIAEFEGYGSLAHNADSCVKLTPTAYLEGESSESGESKSAKVAESIESKSAKGGIKGESATNAKTVDLKMKDSVLKERLCDFDDFKTHPLAPSAREGKNMDSLGVAQTHLLFAKQKVSKKTLDSRESKKSLDFASAKSRTERAKIQSEGKNNV